MPRPITSLFFTALSMWCATASLAQNCPAIQNCIQAPNQVCDISTNDAVFWNAPDFTWSPGLHSADLPEGAADLDLMLIDTCPGILSVKYNLYLDLDGDNLTESVITSDNQMPGGKMLFGNAFSPGYSGTDTIEFDSRAVPDSMKFRFTLETKNNGGWVTAHLRWGTVSQNSGFYTARLPEGRHHIFWTVEKNGVAVAFCDNTFRIKDCLEPTLECLSGWTASIPPNDTLTLHISDFLKTASDNTTPFQLLKFSMRRAGTGSGFPVDAAGNPVTNLALTCPDLGFQNFELWVRDLAGNTTYCEAGLTLFDFAGYCTAKPDPIVCAMTTTVSKDTIRQVYYDLETVPEPGLPQVKLYVTRLPNGCAELPDFSAYPIMEVGVKPIKNDNPLNGVSTFDLVLINRHIIGLQLFNKTWKYLAADANNSGSLTTLDIIELRKLILGIYDSLPHSSSWKFVIADCQLDSLNPFLSVCPNSIVFDPDHIPAEMNFTGIKTGDVNASASADSLAVPPQDREPAILLLPDRRIESGEWVDVPVRLRKPAVWTACQLALRWDPALLDFDALLPGALTGLDENARAVPGPGELRFNWFDTEAHWLLPDEPLCTLRMHARRALRLREALQLAPIPLAPEAYGDEGIAIPLQLEFENSPVLDDGNTLFAPQPNPSAGSAFFPFRLTESATVILELYDTGGQRLVHLEQLAGAGAGALELPAEAQLPPGVYAWRVQVGQMTKAGRLIRL